MGPVVLLAIFSHQWLKSTKLAAALAAPKLPASMTQIKLASIGHQGTVGEHTPPRQGTAKWTLYGHKTANTTAAKATVVYKRNAPEMSAVPKLGTSQDAQ